MNELLVEQLKEYTDKLKTVEREIIRKYKNGEDYSKEIVEANGLRMLRKEVIKMLELFPSYQSIPNPKKV